MKKIENIFYSNSHDENRVLNLYLPDQESFPVFIYFHGGSLETGGHDYQELGEFLTSKGVGLVSVQYRMYPSAKYPDFLEDAAEAVSWTYKNIKEYGNCDKIYIGGSSAGSYISMMLCFDNRWLSKYDISPNSFAGYIHDAGQPTVHFNVLRENKMDTRRVIIDERAPLYHIDSDVNTASMLFVVSDNDMENRYEQIMLTVSTLKHFGYDMSKIKLKVMHGGHCQYVDEKDENGDNIFAKIVYEFLCEF